MNRFEGGPSPEETAAEPSLKEIAQEISKNEEGIVNKIRELINSRVQESRLPTKEGLGYESTIGIYGGKLTKDAEGRLVYDTRGVWSKIDQWGDRAFRSFDEHHARKPLAMFSRRPGAFLKLLPFIADSKRYRGTPEQTIKNANRLGLENYYGSHPWGIEIKDPNSYYHAIGLQDIFRQNEIKSPALADIDRFEALGTATDYLRRLHKTVGGVGETLTSSFLFTKKEEEKVGDPIIAISSLTEVYNPEKNISDIEKKATDLLDLLASVATEEFHRSRDWGNVQKAFNTILDRYQDKKVIAMVVSYVKRGRLTLPNDIEALDFETSPTYRGVRHLFAQHNKQRLPVKNPEITVQIRREIIDICQRYLDANTEAVFDKSDIIDFDKN